MESTGTTAVVFKCSYKETEMKNAVEMTGIITDGQVTVPGDQIDDKIAFLNYYHEGIKDGTIELHFLP